MTGKPMLRCSVQFRYKEPGEERPKDPMLVMISTSMEEVQKSVFNQRAPAELVALLTATNLSGKLQDYSS